MVTRLLAMLLAMHPLHTTMTELTIDPAAHTVRAVTRAFVDDVRQAAGDHITADAYVAGRLAIVDGTQRTVALRECGVKQVGDVIWICVSSSFSGSASRLRVTNGLLCELFEDQVNIVQVIDGVVRKSILFVKGDRAKNIL